MSEFGPAFDRAQAAHDAQEPPEPHNCEQEGHDWRRTGRTSPDGDVYEVICMICGQKDVV